MKHLFVPYELTIKLKEKGFDEKCFGHYGIKTKEFRTGYPERYSSEFPFLIAAPLYQQVVDWFRGKHNIHIEIWFDETQTDAFVYLPIIYQNRIMIESFNQEGNYYDNYYEALTKAIEEALNLI